MQAFKCGVMNAYASSEHLTMGGAMPGGDEIVLYDDDLIFEFRPDHCLVTNLFISPHTINEVFVKGVTRFQLHLLDTQSFRFLVCLDSQLDAAQREECVAGVTRRLSEILARKLMENVQFTVDVVDDLPVNPKTRKFQLIVDKRNVAAA